RAKSKGLRVKRLSLTCPLPLALCSLPALALCRVQEAFRLRAAITLGLTSVSGAFFFVVLLTALTMGLRDDRCKLFFSAVIISILGISSISSNSTTFLPLILESI